MNTGFSTSTIYITDSDHDYGQMNCYQNDLSRDLIQQKQEYEEEIAKLKATHHEQISKLCNEIEQNSSLLYQYRLQLDFMRTSINMKEKQNQEPNLIQDLQTKNAELTTENTKLKNNLLKLGKKHKALSNEVQNARKYLLKMINNSD